MTAPKPATVQAVWERDQGSCAMCGRGLTFEHRGTEWSVHHRVGRQMGGSKSEWINQPGNLVTLCGTGTTGCHGRITHSSLLGQNLGFVVRRGFFRPDEIAVRHALFGVCFLDNEGGVKWRPDD